MIGSRSSFSSDQTPPHDIDIEEYVIGAALLEKSAQQVVVEMLTDSDFHDSCHALIFSAMLDMAKDGQPINMRSIVHHLKTKNSLETAGGAFKIAELTSKVSSAADLRFSCLILKQFTIKRSLITMGMQLQRKGMLDDVDSFDLLNEAEKTLQSITNNLPKKSETSIKDILTKLTNAIQVRENADYSLTGIPSGFPMIDKLTQGWQRTDLIIIAARPGMGKSAFVLQCLMNAAVDFKIPVGLFSLEMSSDQLGQRAASIATEIPLTTIRSRPFDGLEWTNYANKISKLMNAPVFIDDTAGLTILELRARCRRMVAEHGVQLIVIDYLQLMAGDKQSRGNREQEISNISRALKGIAKELNIPILALSQLSRAVETRGGDKKPLLADLRESGSIEQDADIVVFLWRPEYYSIEADSIGEFLPGATEVNFAKHRNGSTDRVFIQFVPKFTKFQHVEWPYIYNPKSEPQPLERPLRVWTEPEPPPLWTQPDNQDTPF